MADWLLLVLRIVAVLFGGLGGAFVGTVLAPLLVGDSKRKRVPVVLICAGLGGFALWLATHRVGGGGGEGPGGPGAGGYAGSTDEGDGRGPRSTQKRPAAPAAVLHVHLLGGQRVKDQRCYVIDHEPPRNWDELIEAITTRRKADPALKTIDIVIHPDSVDRDNPVVLRLKGWATDHDLTPTMSFPSDKAPG
jgi:hypothetical protein